ncbi:DUF1330 domain-containing protein [Marinobacteraceae bacterium S3BR75-40.1]
MNTVNPTRDQLETILAQVPMDQPVVMLNLLRFREQAQYAGDSAHSPVTGREAYQRYAAVAQKKLVEIGARVEWAGRSLGTLIGPEEKPWDEVFLVRYPTAQAFFNMLSMPDYQAAAEHRTAALEDSRLIVTQGEIVAPSGASQ